ncbi:MAG TPA: TonB-dependent receptor, partial [Sphingomicrobium sp.]|nr:TonB-dependent receptor [Sphingomicrobium sp.]
AGRTFVPADFARYSPKTALDMINQIPGFSIRADQRMRGLGQATDNVLFNGERPSGKSDDIFAQLGRIPASSVVRIEIVDAASLNIPGLSGQVANVVFKTDSLSGQFAWSPEFRPHNTDPLLTRGNASFRGTAGPIKYEVGLNNDESGRSGADGPTRILNGSGAVIEHRIDSWNSHYDSPKLSGKLTWDGPGSMTANLNGQYQRVYERYDEVGERSSAGSADRLRTVAQRSKQWSFELGGDVDFALGPGRMKAIALRSFSHEPSVTDVITEFADGSTPIGDRFRQRGNLGETIGRGEYSWKMLGGDWQLSAEAAFNTLDSVAGIGVLDPQGNFIEQPFSGGTGGVKEDRYESLLSVTRKLSETLSIQLVGGAEHSTIVQTGDNGLSRSFFRPKGSLSVSWAPRKDLDLSFKVRRRVLQLNFYDFLARAFLNDGNANAANVDLRPQQDWSYEGEINKKLGPWGSAQLRFVYRDVEDFVDIIPVEGGEAVGNIPTSWAAAVVPSATITFDPIGLKGVKLNATVVLQKSSVEDPFTGDERPWSGFVDRQANFALRHDIPGSSWAWGMSANHNHVLPRYRSNQVDRSWEGPWFVSAFVENKNVAGMTVRAQVGNLLGARSLRERIIYQGLRGVTPVALIESRDRRIGPVFSMSVRGNL